MADYAVMPKADYLDACNAIREKTGSTAVIKSGDMGTQIRAIKTGGDYDPSPITIKGHGSAYVYDVVSHQWVEPTPDGITVTVSDHILLKNKVELMAGGIIVYYWYIDEYGYKHDDGYAMGETIGPLMVNDIRYDTLRSNRYSDKQILYLELNDAID